MDGGAEWIQYRHKALFDREAAGELAALAESCRRRGVVLLVNDRADLAARFQSGCHVGQDDLPPSAVRALIGDAVLGFSTHDARQLAAGDAEPVDYLAYGPVFTTASKQNPDPVVGIEGLRRAREITRKPLVAIGGLTRSNARAALAAGADCLAVIGDLLPEPLTPSNVRTRMEEWLEQTK